ncbi:MAG: hypothetical protein ACRCU2_30490 [Planktothrix sp.]
MNPLSLGGGDWAVSAIWPIASQAQYQVAPITATANSWRSHLVQVHGITVRADSLGEAIASQLRYQPASLELSRLTV